MTRNPLLKRKAWIVRKPPSSLSIATFSRRAARARGLRPRRQPMIRSSRFRVPGVSLLAAAFLTLASPLFAQTTEADPQTAVPDPLVPAPPLPAEVDLNLINLPTTLSLQRHRGYFRLTHRFARDLRR